MNCQDHLYRNANPTQVARRWFLQQCGVGLGSLALGQLLNQGGYAAPASATLPGGDPLAPKAPHHAPKAKRVIFLFMAGAPSHLELFDNKPQLAKFDGTLPPPELLKGIARRSSIRTPSCSGRSSSSLGTARAARSSRNCSPNWPRSLTTLRSCAR